MIHLQPFVVVAALLATILPSLADSSCTVIADAATGKILQQDGPCDQRVSPASTFKIAISLMGYDSGFLKDEHTPVLPFKEGYVDYMPDWKQPIDPTMWIKYSVVWYSQQITRSLGEEKFQKYVTAFNYGNKDVSGNPGKHDGLTRAWLSSSLQISPIEQTQFLRKLVRHELPVSAHAFKMTKKITSLDALPNGWELYGKTGTGITSELSFSGQTGTGRTPAVKNTDPHPVQIHAPKTVRAWFVGWVTNGKRTLVFARLEEKYTDAEDFNGPKVRDEFISQLPAVITSITK